MTEPTPPDPSRRAFLRLSRNAAIATGLGIGLAPLWRGGVRAQDFLLPATPLVAPVELSDRLIPALSGCPTAARLLQDEFRLVDARKRPAFLEGHALTAVQLEAEGLSAVREGVAGMLAPIDEVAVQLGGSGIDPAFETIVYSDEGNLWASRLFWILEYLGHSDVRILDGGAARWSRDLSMVAEGEPSAVPDVRSFVPTPQADKIVDAAWIEERLGSDAVVFVDARDAAAFERGHLPGAVNLPWRGNIDWDDETFLPFSELVTRFRDAGVTPDSTVVSYCQLGVLSAHNYVAMRLLGYPDVRLYDGSWADWSSQPDRPVATGS
jgi:thiosulfate/3-mercaptopyruvate sulfurtransferase